MTAAVEGFPIDEEDMPDWCDKYLTPNQVESLLPRTRWAVLLDSAPLSPVAHHVALRIHLYAVGSVDCTAHPSVGKLAAVTGWTRNPIRAALRELEGAGWVQAQGRKYPSGKRASTLYTLTWPSVDVMMTPAKVRCMAPRKGGLPCGKGAGWGTSHPGTGTCSLHDDEPVGGHEKTPRGSREDPLSGSPEDPLGGHEKTPSAEVGDEQRVQSSCGHEGDRVGEDDDADDLDEHFRLRSAADLLLATFEFCTTSQDESNAITGWRRRLEEDGWEGRDIALACQLARAQTEAA